MIEHEAEAAILESFGLGEVARSPQQAPDEGVVLRGEVREARDVPLRDHEHMHGTLGVDVVEREDGIVLVGHPGGDPARDDLTEQTGHGE